MQIEVTYAENSYLRAVSRLKDAIEAYTGALRELHSAKKEFDEAEHALVPELPQIG